MKDEKTSAFFCTGVLATPEEVKAMKAQYGMPVMVVGGRLPESPQEMMHRFALAHGLPEIAGHYGCDFRDGEFIREKDALDRPVDSWESYEGREYKL